MYKEITSIPTLKLGNFLYYKHQSNEISGLTYNSKHQTRISLTWKSLFSNGPTGNRTGNPSINAPIMLIPGPPRPSPRDLLRGNEFIRGKMLQFEF